MHLGKVSADIIHLDSRTRKYKFSMKSSAWTEKRALTGRKSDFFTKSKCF
jgi:hypothetical protein